MRQFDTGPPSILYFREKQTKQFNLSDLNCSIVKIQLLQDVSSTNYDYRIKSAREVDKLVGPEPGEIDLEYLFVNYLNSRNKVIDIEVVDIDSMSQVSVHPREVIKSDNLANAHSFILVHNHSSGDQQPAKEDTTKSPKT